MELNYEKKYRLGKDAYGWDRNASLWTSPTSDMGWSVAEFECLYNAGVLVEVVEPREFRTTGVMGADGSDYIYLSNFLPGWACAHKFDVIVRERV